MFFLDISRQEHCVNPVYWHVYKYSDTVRLTFRPKI